MGWSRVLGFVFFLEAARGFETTVSRLHRLGACMTLNCRLPSCLARAVSCLCVCLCTTFLVRRCFVRFEVLLSLSLVLVRFGHPLVSFGTQYFVTIRTTIPTFFLIITRPSAALSQRLSIHRWILRVGSIPAYSIALAERSLVLER